MQRDFLPWHFHPGHPLVVPPVRVDPTGRHGPTPKAVRCSRWRRVGPGWAVAADVDSSVPDQRIVEAAVRLTRYGAVTGWAALHWMGARWFDGGGEGYRLPVALATGDAGIRAAPGVTVSEERLLPADVIVVDGLRVTTAVRSVLFEMRHAKDELAAVTALDMACYSDLVSTAEAATYAETLGTWTGIPLARTVLPRGEENAWSPAEVAMGEIWVGDAGLARPLANVPLFDLGGRHLVTPDLIDPVLGVIGEFNGAVHLDRATQQRDVRRDDVYRRNGLDQVTMTAPDLTASGPAVARLRAAAARGAARPTADRTWTAVPPSWWTPTTTVAQRRRLSPRQQARFLRYRDAA